MATKPAEVLLHPTRLRIVLAMIGGEMTTVGLHDRLPDVAPATLYRQIAALVDAGLLEVVKERQVRGGRERTYRVVESRVHVGRDGAGTMTHQEHLTGLVTFAGAMIQSFGRYLDQVGSDPGRDGVSYRRAGLWLTSDELDRMIADLGAALAPYLGNEPSPERSLFLLNTILMPDASPPN